MCIGRARSYPECRVTESLVVSSRQPILMPPCRHTGQPDNIMKEIPTVVVSPMPESYYPHRDYVVLNRPYAVRGRERE